MDTGKGGTLRKREKERRNHVNETETWGGNSRGRVTNVMRDKEDFLGIGINRARTPCPREQLRGYLAERKEKIPGYLAEVTSSSYLTSLYCRQKAPGYSAQKE